MTTQTSLQLVFGDVLPNGSTVVSFDAETRTVLAKHGSQFVTWKVDESGNCFWGNYFPIKTYSHRAIVLAAADYEERVNRSVTY